MIESPAHAAEEATPTTLGADHSAREPTPVFRVATEHQAHVLYEQIVLPGRRYPIVGLTCRPGLRREPALSVERAKAVVWPGVPIYIIEPRESRTLNDLLPPNLGAYNGAVRVWWPGVDENCVASWHPLIHDSRGFYGEDVVERLAEQFATPHPDTIYDLPPEKQAATRERLRIAAKSKRVVTVASFKDVRSLTSDLRRTGRDYPIVVISTPEGASEPLFSLGELRDAVDPYVPIFVLSNGATMRRLIGTLGAQLGVSAGAARIYWPGLDRRGDPAEHPLVACEGGNGVARLVEALNLSRPEVRGHLEYTNGRMQNARQRASETTRELRETRAERDAALQRAKSAEAALGELQRQRRALEQPGIDEELRALASLDAEALMQRLICHEWLTALKPRDRHDSPLRAYRLGPRFLDSINDRKIVVPRQRVAFACAMVACGRAAELPGLEPHPWREGKASGSGDDPQAVRADGAKGFICNLGHGRGAARLLYWALPNGVVEFDSVRLHEAIALGVRG
ncbi:MAG TPA: hypothetical protein VMF09_11590 [Solirubrobacteraceae bacterium]|nr:hypothetical protein [Solirubrobacteraceae bacterium]